MNICYLSREYPPKIIGGVGTYVYESAKAMRKLGHNVYVITEALDTEKESIEEGICVIRVVKKEIRFLSLLREKLSRTVERLEYSYAVSKKLRQVSRKYRIDIVESCEARAEGLWYYLFHRKPRLVIKLHTPEGIISRWNRDPRSLDNKIVEKIEEFWILRANKVIAISMAMVGLLRRYYDINFTGIPVVPNPIDTALFKPAAENINNQEQVILYTGRLEFRKGVHVLMRAIPKVFKQAPAAKFIFIGGDCGMKSYLLKKIAEYQFGDRVILMEHVAREELVGLMQKSSVCVIPSLWENFPYTCLEAMSCAKAVVASCTGGIPEIIEHGKNGLLFPAGSSNALAEAIISILQDNTLRNKLADNARDAIESRFSPADIAEKTLLAYYQN